MLESYTCYCTIVFHSFKHLFTHKVYNLSIYLFIHLSICLPSYPSIYLSYIQFICLMPAFLYGYIYPLFMYSSMYSCIHSLIHFIPDITCDNSIQVQIQNNRVFASLQQDVYQEISNSSNDSFLFDTHFITRKSNIQLNVDSVI